MNILIAQVQSQSMRWGEILLSAYRTSDSVSQGIIWVLLAFSVTAGTVILCNLYSTIVQSRNANTFMRYYDKIHSPVGMGLYLEKLSGPLRNVCETGLIELCNVLGIDEAHRWNFYRTGTMPKKLTPSDIEKIRVSMNRQVNHEVLELESGMWLLSICVTVAPFLGLFGTVWGVMATFMAIANTGSAELTALAPGISGALLTTVIGLFVAIPSVFFNILINTAQNKVCLKMDVFLDEFVASLNLESSEDQQP